MINYILQEVPDITGEGKRNVYPKFVQHNMIDYDSFVKRVCDVERAFNETAVKGVIESVSRQLIEHLSMGHAVKIDGIGVFSLSLEFYDDKPTEITDEKDKMMYRGVRVRDWTLKTDPDTLQRLRRKTKCNRAESGVRKLKKNPFTLEQRIANALKVIDTKGFLTLADYVMANHICRTSASVELKRICAMPGSRITATGQGSHKVWVRRDELERLG